jgi:hypothetical protein
MSQILADPSDIGSVPEKITVLQRLAANPQIRSGVLGFVREEAGPIISQLTTRAITAFIGTLTSFVGTPEELEIVIRPVFYTIPYSQILPKIQREVFTRLFFIYIQINLIISENSSSFTDAEKNTLNNHVRTIQANIIWRAENEERLGLWFSQNV